jgi:hypothetical protein
MKSLIFLLTVFAVLSANAQITVQETPKDSVLWQASKLATLPKIRVGEVEGTNFYTIYYRNAKYTHITDVKYIMTGELESTIYFYETCLAAVAEDKEFIVTIGNESIHISKSMGSTMIWTDVGYFYLTKKQLDSILLILKK